jgi:hypothetical protein
MVQLHLDNQILILGRFMEGGGWIEIVVNNFGNMKKVTLIFVPNNRFFAEEFL